MRQLVVATDIFGITPLLQQQLQLLQQQTGGQLLLVSPYPDQRYFTDEALAYACFMEEGGVSAYQQRFAATWQQQAQRRQRSASLFVGFSAGAAALWQWLAVSEQAKTLQATTEPAATAQWLASAQAWLLYGGQIRQQPALQPAIACRLSWSAETHFDVVQLQQQIVSCRAAAEENSAVAAGPLLQQDWITSDGFIPISPKQPPPAIDKLLGHGCLNPYSSHYHNVITTAFWRAVQQAIGMDSNIG